jgi:hypothetical protein
VGKDLAENPKHFTDLFVYNYDRPYPTDLVTKPIALFSSRPLWTGDLVTLVLLGFGVYLGVEAFTAKERTPLGSRALALGFLLGGVATLVSMGSRGQVSALALAGIAQTLVGGFLLWQASRPGTESRTSTLAMGAALMLFGVMLAIRGFRAPLTLDPLLRALSEPVNVKRALGFAFTVGGAVAAIAALQRARTLLFGSFWVLAAGFALWFNWNHWVDLSHHWTQRDLFWRYYAQRQPGEPITAFLMNWRGETFYSRNTVRQIKDNASMATYAAQPGREWALVEHNRLNVLRTAVGQGKVVTPIDRDINNKFVLVTIE